MNFRLFRPRVCRPWLWPYIVVVISNEMVGCCCDWPWILKLFTRWLTYIRSIATVHGNGKQEVWPSISGLAHRLPISYGLYHLDVYAYLYTSSCSSICSICCSCILNLVHFINSSISEQRVLHFHNLWWVPLFSLLFSPLIGNSALAIRIEKCFC